MKLCHITYDAMYRTPFGAAELGQSVTLTLDSWEGMARACDLRLWQEGVGETVIPMAALEADAPDGSGCPCRRFAVTFSPDTLGVLWYSFRVTGCDGGVVWYGAQQGWTTGQGCLYDHEPPSFQITVYQTRCAVFSDCDLPEWYTNGVVYQIFPDRFARGADWPQRAQAVLSAPRKGPDRALVEDWNTSPTYEKTAQGDIARWDFYGGSLQGIRQKLDYLQNLGVTVLYLNPVFEAASNHRYDTADYLNIDPMLGTVDDFCALADDLHARGMRLILDGVFNHCGQDSRYFNAYGNYPDKGAAQSEASAYRSWFHFHEDGSYESWWGVKDLPEYEENDPDLREYFCGENGVVRTWLRSGADGWRLDVADELPDSFIEDIKAAALAEKPDALVIGEVWEDASSKYAYGQLRHYFQGRELDGVMNYPFRSMVIDYLTGAIDAGTAAGQMRQLQQNYPAENFTASLNLLGSHDRERIMTMLGDAPHKDALSEVERAGYRLSPEQRQLALNRLKLAITLQMTAPGVPSIYYGDEAGLEGFSDPTNRAAMPWGHFDAACFDIYRAGVALRHSLPLFTQGSFEPVNFGSEVLGWWRRLGEESVCVLVNRSPWDWANVSVPAAGEVVSELGRAESAFIVDGQVQLALKPFEYSILYFHARAQLQKPLKPGMGLIAHLTSVAAPDGPGTLGAPARAFVDCLSRQGYTYWQMLPVNPTDAYGSPYAGLSAFAGNPRLLERNTDSYETLDLDAYQAFCKENAEWLHPYAAFCAIKALVGEVPWQEWPDSYNTYRADLLEAPELKDEITRICCEQFFFQQQWDELKAYANAHGVSIVGDLPMYVSADSSDVWAHPELFNLDGAGYPAGIAGVPPDDLGPEGQVWGNPTYRWDRMAADGYDWWMRRLERMFSLYDYVRMDHFLGFSSYYEILPGETALTGQWHYGPGRAFFERAYDYFGGPLPLIGENLGTITPAVRALVATCGFPGMDVIQFADNDPRDAYTPAPETLIYLGTHDTQTLVGWCETRYGLSREDAQSLAKELMSRTVLEHPDRVVIMQLQDVLLLGNEARMNVPGVASGNWTWQVAGMPYVAGSL